MTDDEAKTCLLLGMKIRRSKWKGYLCIIKGELHKIHESNDEEGKIPYECGPFSSWCSESALHQFGPWEKVNEC